MSDKPDAVAMRALIAAHPAIFRGDEPRVWSHLPPGWHEILDRLCVGIEQTLGDEISRFRVEQIKEKYGGLRFYYSLEGDSRRVIDTLFPGGRLRMQDHRTGTLAARIDALIDAAEVESERTCRECGEPGKLRESTRGWLRVTCEAHSEPGDEVAAAEDL